MPSDYEAIRREKPENYVGLAEKVSEQLLSRQYADRTHFVFELLQNAEDALRQRGAGEVPRRVRFMLEKRAVRFSHFGLPFDEKDVRAVCDILVTTKDEITEIGHFGIGFKSVGAVTGRPEVHSGDEHFAIERYVLPTCVPALSVERGETVIVLPLRDGDTDAPDEIARQFERLGDQRTLLFLREMNEIEWSVEGGPSGYCRREEIALSDVVRRVRLVSQVEGEDPLDEEWLVFSREVRHDKRSVGHVELAFGIETDDSGDDVIEATEDFALFAFFPTEVPTRLGMLVQGPYRTTPARDNIPRDDDWNRYLVEETASLLVDALCYLRDRGLLGVHVFDALPLSRQRFVGRFFEPMFDAVRKAIRSKPLLPAHRGRPVPASRARLTDEPGLRNLISRQQLAKLLGQDKPVAWLSRDITRNSTPDLYRYLTNEQGVEELEISDLLALLRDNKGFLEGQTDRWIRRLYEFLGKGDMDSRDYLLLLDDVPLIRLEDGTHIEWLWGKPVAYLQTEPPSELELPTVHPAVSDSARARKFLKSLDVVEPDEVNEIERGVLPKYGEGNGVRLREYATDLRHFVEVFASGSREQRGRLTDVLGGTPFVRAVDAGTGATSWVRPADVYVGLDDLFNGVEGVLVAAKPPRGVRQRELTELLEACGASRTLAVRDSAKSHLYQEHWGWIPSRSWSPYGITYDHRLGMRRTAGQERVTKDSTEVVTNREYRGLSALLEHLPTLPAEDAAARAKLLWQALSAAPSDGFEGTYRWEYYGPHTRRFDSTSVGLLSDTAWVPDESGSLQPPGSVEFAPLGWRPDPFLESVIKFREPEPLSEIAALAEKADVDPDVLGAVKELQDAGFTPDEIREIARSRQEADPPDGGTASTPDGVAGGGGAPRAGTRPHEGATRSDREVATGGATRSGRTTAGGQNARTGGGRTAFQSYIGVERESEPTEEGRRESDRRMGVEAAAIEFILQREPSLEPTPPGNPGFDLYEPGDDGEPVRWVEVKALSGEWQANVALSHTQFEYAWKHREAYWLYVVEHAGTDDPRIVRIQNPAGRDSTYTFDHGWREAAEGASE